MTATELKKRAIALAEKTKIDSVTPEEVGQLSNDIVEYIENVEINGSSLGIRKTYTSVSAMEADSTAPKDDKGVFLRRGMLENLYNVSDLDSADNGKVFSFQNPGWAFRGTVDAGYATKEELTELSDNVGLYNVDKNVPLGSGFYTSTTARAAVPSSVRKLGLIITYKTDATTSVTEQFIGSSVSAWNADTNWKNVGSEGGNKILEWNTDVATTRKQVPSKERKSGMIISYKNPDGDWVNEQYIHTDVSNAQWALDIWWVRLANEKDLYLTDLLLESVIDFNTLPIQLYDCYWAKDTGVFTKGMTGWVVLKKIPCFGLQQIELNVNAIRAIYYDAHDKYLSQWTGNTTNKFPIPEGTVYVGINIGSNISDKTNIIIKGTRKDNKDVNTLFEDVSSLNDKMEKVNDIENTIFEEFGISLAKEKLAHASWQSSNGSYSVENAQASPYWVATERKFSIPSSKEIHLINSGDVKFYRVLFYDENDDYLGIDKSVTNTKDLTSSNIPNEAKYFTFNFYVPASSKEEAINTAKNYSISLKAQEEDTSQEIIYNEKNFFTVEVNAHNPIKTVLTAQEQTQIKDEPNMYEDYCQLLLPKGHSNKKAPLKVVVFFHGGGEAVTENAGFENFAPAVHFLYRGYAVLATNGLPHKLASENGLSVSRPVGNWMAVESAVKALEYSIKNFNIDRDGVYAYGYSQGGMTALNFVDLGNFNVKAVTVDSPAASMKYSQLTISDALVNLQYFYGFNSLETFSYDKVSGLDPYSRNCTEIVDASQYVIGNLFLDGELDKIKSLRFFKCPTRFFIGDADSTCKGFVSQVMVKQGKNAGQFCDCSIYKGVGHCVDRLATTLKTISYNSKEYDITQPMVDMAIWFSRFGGYTVVE